MFQSPWTHAILLLCTLAAEAIPETSIFHLVRSEPDEAICEQAIVTEQVQLTRRAIDDFFFFPWLESFNSSCPVRVSLSYAMSLKFSCKTRRSGMGPGKAARRGWPRSRRGCVRVIPFNYPG